MRVFRCALQSIVQNKLRSVLAGFGIAWGIFLLVIFLGIGDGFRDGVMELFNAFAQKSLFVYGGQTSVAGEELNEGTMVLFDIDVAEKVKNRYGSVVSCSSEMSSSLRVTWNGETTSSSVNGVESDYFDIRILKIESGRGISLLDDMRSRDVAVIGEGLQKALFGKKSPLGQFIVIEGAPYKVIGVLSSEDLFSIQERNSIYVPASSFAYNFNSEGKVQSFCLSLSENANTSEIEDDLKGYLAHLCGFDPHDEQALYVENIEAQTATFESLFHGLEVLIWIIAVCLLLSGIVGVCNVMLIMVKERTNEIGIRKAVGATSNSIISMIMAESVVITFIAGITGIVLGSFIILIVNEIVVPMLNADIMKELKINLPTILVAFVFLGLSGMLSGLFPALKASQISPVDAIRYENRG